MMHKNREKENDWQRNANQPKQYTSSKTHVGLLLTEGSTPEPAESFILGTAETELDTIG